MTPYVSDPDFQLFVGDALEVLRGLPDESVHCCVTSPPYWGLRDYGSEGQIGLEPTPDAYVAAMVDVFREVRRVLRRDGSLFLNIGDSYVSGQGGRQSAVGELPPVIRRDRPAPKKRPELENAPSGWAERAVTPRTYPGRNTGLKPKDLVGIPWMLAFALRADGWYLRSDIVWSKPNPMPESVTDRPTKAHEYVFLLTRSPRYFFDQEAVREADRKPEGWQHVPESKGFNTGDRLDGGIAKTGNAQTSNGLHRQKGGVYNPAGRNIRSVWEIATQPYPQAHFATFPEALPDRCIRAGTSERGCCPECGAPWEREVERVDSGRTQKMADGWDTGEGGHGTVHRNGRERGEAGIPVLVPQTVGWHPSCDCTTHVHPEIARDVAAVPVPCTVLDPFMGSGTTALVARKLGRRSIGIELNPEYAALAADRLKQLSLFAGDAA